MSLERFVARQPIFNAQEKVAGYELLFRSSLENVFAARDHDQASREVVDNLFLMGVEVLAGGQRAFINFTRTLLVEDFATLLPKDAVVVEILESVQPDPPVVEACRRLKTAGYLIALDDFVGGDGLEEFVDLADYIKVEFAQTSAARRQNLVELYAPRGIRMLAEKVETRADFEEARGCGYQFFQGYFFCRPEILSRRDIPACKFNYLRILKLVNDPDLQLRELEEVLKVEASLCYRLLRYLNSPLFAFHNEITSIGHALALLGETQTRKWASMVTLIALAEDKPAELVRSCLVRAKFCESMASFAGMHRHRSDLFLVGLLSLLDTILGRPLPELLGELPLSDDVKAALLQQGGRLQPVYDLVLAYELGEWERFSEMATRMRLKEELVPELHLRAVEWASQSFHYN